MSEIERWGEQRPLKTWKEIADYLGVSVRTAQLWEKDRGLPVRRMEGVKPQVWILTQDLELWWQTQQRPAESDILLNDEILPPAQPLETLTTLSASRSADGRKDAKLWGIPDWHLAFCCLLYAALFVLDLLLEVAYQFDHYRYQVLVAAPLLGAWICVTAGIGLWLAWRITTGGGNGGFAALVGFFISSALLAFAAVARILPAEPITVLRTLPQTAQAAFLKNIVFYFLPLITVAWLIPFQYVMQVRRAIIRGQTENIQMPLDAQGTPRIVEAVYIPVKWLWIGILVVALVSIFATQDLLSRLAPGRFANFFMLLAISKTSVYLSLGVASIAWYSKALEGLKEICTYCACPLE